MAEEKLVVQLEDLTKPAPAPSAPAPTPAPTPYAAAPPIPRPTAAPFAGLPAGEISQLSQQLLGRQLKTPEALTSQLKAAGWSDAMLAQFGAKVAPPQLAGAPTPSPAAPPSPPAPPAGKPPGGGDIPYAELAGEEGAAGGLGGLGGMLGAAGPAGAVVAVAMLAKKKLTDMVNAIGNTAAAVGTTTAYAARGENAKAVGSAAEGANELVKKIPVVGEQLGLLGDVAIKVTKSFVGVVDAFVERGRELSAYSGPLAQSFALSQVQTILDDLTEAQDLGPGLARLNDSYAEFTHEFRRILLPIKSVVVDRLATLLEGLATIMVRMEQRIDDAGKAANNTGMVLAPILTLIARAIGLLPSQNAEEQKKLELLAKDEKFWASIEKKLQDMAPPVPFGGFPVPAVFPGQRALPPLLGGQGMGR